jgi:hypothetical protein
MATVHDLIERFGYDTVRKATTLKHGPTGEVIEFEHHKAAAVIDNGSLPITPETVDAAYNMLTQERDRMGVTYSGFAFTSLPHKRLKTDQPWDRKHSGVELRIHPGELPSPKGGYQLYGVPYGAKARLILIYLMGEAIGNNTQTVTLGKSMYEWLGKMGLSIGGQTYKSVRDQALRLSACSLTFTWRDGKRVAFQKDQLIKGGFFAGEGAADDRQARLWDDAVTLGDTFFAELKNHYIKLSEHALAQMTDNSLSIDLYVWLAFRLPHISRAERISWPALAEQFGQNYGRLRDFRRRFIDALSLTLAVYQDANIDVHEQGLTLHPSRAPLEHRKVPAGRIAGDHR